MDDPLLVFVRARFDEREARAKAAEPGPWRTTGAPDEEVGVGPEDFSIAFDYTGQHRASYEHIADNDPRFVLADVAAKRRIVERYEEHAKKLARLNEKNSAGKLTQDQAWQRSELGVKLRETRHVLKLLALPHAGHAHYDESWRP